MVGFKGAGRVLRISLASGTLLTIFALNSVVWASPARQEAVTVDLTPGTASTLTSADGMVSVAIPAAAPAAAGTLSYDKKTGADAPAASPAGLAFGSALFELTVLDTGGTPVSDYRFSSPIIISIKYTADDLAAAEGNPSRLVLQGYDTALKAWTPLSTTFDPANKAVKAQVTRPSFFALMGQAQQPTSTPTPTPTRAPWMPTPTPTITPTPTLVPPTATVTPIAPPAGDVAPGPGLLVGLLIAALILMAAGGYYLRHAGGE